MRAFFLTGSIAKIANVLIVSLLLIPAATSLSEARSYSLLSATQAAQSQAISKSEFDVIEGIFHDGLGTYAEVMLANELISLARFTQPQFDASRSKAKMLDAINRLPQLHPSRELFKQEIANVETAVKLGAVELLRLAAPARLISVRHTAREFADAKAGDIRLVFEGRADMPVSVKTDKSGKVAVSEGQTPDVGAKWAERYFRVSQSELEEMIRELGFQSMGALKSNYLNVARLVAHIMIRKLKLEACEPANFSRARVGDLDAAKYLLRQLIYFKRGSDRSRVIIFDRKTGEVKWESLLDGINIESLTADRITFLPSRPRGGNTIASEFGIKIDGRTVVSFQIKHRRGSSRGTARQYEFSDITTRLRI